jgi:hypothetical protein
MQGEGARHFYSSSRVTVSVNIIDYQSKIEILTKNENAISILLEMTFINQNFYTIKLIEKFKEKINKLSSEDSYKLDLIFDHGESNLVYHTNGCTECIIKILDGKNKEKVTDYIEKFNKNNYHESDTSGKPIFPNLD